MADAPLELPPVDRMRLGFPHQPLKGIDLKNRTLFEANGGNLLFEDCDFSFSVIERTYFHKARFKSCKFVGVKFIDSNFRKARFDNCDFRYASVQRTLFDKQELIRNLPAEPNLSREWLQQLRVNALSLGITQEANFFIVHELEAEREHWRRARRAADVYYSTHYSGFGQKVHVYAQSLKLWLDHYVWGHGESIPRLIAATAGCLVLLAFILFLLQSGGDSSQALPHFADSLSSTWRLFWDFPSVNASLTDRHPVWSPSCAP